MIFVPAMQAVTQSSSTSHCIACMAVVNCKFVYNILVSLDTSKAIGIDTIMMMCVPNF